MCLSKPRSNYRSSKRLRWGLLKAEKHLATKFSNIRGQFFTAWDCHYDKLGSQAMWSDCAKIRRKFATWTIDFFGLFFTNYRCSPKFWATVFQSIYYALILTKFGLGYILGDFFTNSSGHHAPTGELWFLGGMFAPCSPMWTLYCF
jgi:hypothetical protein